MSEFIDSDIKNQLHLNAKSERLVYPDVMRSVAITFVVILHVSSGMMWALTPDMWQFNWLASVGALSRCSVTLFLMLSGMLLLKPQKELTLSMLFRKYVLRLFLAYVVWSAVYALFTSITNDSLLTGGLKGLWALFFNGHYHLWYLPMMIGIYLTIPFFKSITDKQDRKLLHYVIAIFCIFLIAYPNIPGLLPNVHNVLSRINPGLFGIYAAYFFAGYYLSTIKVSRPGKIIWLVIMVISAIWLVRTVCSSSAALGALDESNWGLHKLPLATYRVSVFMVLRNFGDIAARSKKVCWFVRKLSKLSFIVYLSHDLFIKILALNGINALTWHPVISVPVLTAAVLISSMILSAVLLMLKKLLLRRRHA